MTAPTDATARTTARDRAWIEVDLGAVVRNARTLAARAKKPLLPMVKADAYGLGAVPVVKALEAIDPWGYGVATIEEARELRDAGISRPILLVTPTVTSPAFKAIRELRVTPSFGEARVMLAWHQSGGGDYHLAIDTGMNRAGIRFDNIACIADLTAACPPTGAYTHFHSSETGDGSMQLQIDRFKSALAALPVKPPLLHCENSGAIVRTSPSPWSLVRPGVFLYGVGSGAQIEPEPVVRFYAQVVDIHDVQPGDSVSYNASWKATRPTRVATVAAGYADGYRRLLGNKGTILVNGRRAKVVGTVTMDMTMIDVTDIPCERGDVATLIGSDGNERVTVEDVAAACGLSPYEILTSLRARAPRVYR